jgi:DNA-binding NarL/FixJ family response regulator
MQFRDAKPKGLTAGPRALQTEAPRVLIAEEHPATRAGLRLTLEAAGLSVCAEVGSAEASVAAALGEQPDICLLDMDMPGGGIRAAAEISQRLPRAAVVMLTSSTNEEDLFDALRAGASGYLLKDTSPARLPNALRAVLRGEAALPRALVGRVIEQFRERGRRRNLQMSGERGVDLTSREWEVLELLRQGFSTKEIARRLAISQVTVRRHIGAILKKLRVPSRQAALALLEERSQN